MDASTTSATISVSCKVAGTLTIPNEFLMDGNTSISGNLADYTANSAEQLQSLGARSKWVDRNGKVIKGSDYTLKMAQNDFKKYAK